MINFEFHMLYYLIGKDISDPEAKVLFDSIYRDYTDYFLIHEPERDDIKNDRIAGATTERL